MADVKKSLLLLFQKPNEPLFTPKDDGKTAFDVPPDFYTDRYRTIGTDLSKRFAKKATNIVVLEPIITYPDIKFALPLKRNDSFSLFIESHTEMAAKLMQIFIDQPDPKTLLSVAGYIRDRINVDLFQYAYSVALQHRKDTKDLVLPSVISMFPDKFFDPSAFPKAREEGTLIEQGKRQHIVIPMEFTSNDREIEQKLAYFREDIGVNIHHWHWHLVYPHRGPESIVKKDRRGELFYYMHNQVMARYNVDRFCVGLQRAKPLKDVRSAIAEAYFPKIIRSSNSRAYPPRTANSILQDVNRVDNTIEVDDIVRWRDRIYHAIDQGHVVDSNGKIISLKGLEGIDILGNMVESSDLSPNRPLYGDLHNQGHNIISYIHDPEQKYLEEFGVMGDVTTACRDPIFYRWHSFIDGVFQRHKKLLPPYDAKTEFAYDGVIVSSVSVQIRKEIIDAKENTLMTFWQTSEVDLKTGLDFGPEGNIFAKFAHLQYAPFEYTISLENLSDTEKLGTCRIFMCPKNNERDQPIQTFEEMRTLMMEMDKFTINMKPGKNEIRRRSSESTVTISYERTFREMGQVEPDDPIEKENFQFCGCGWPQHMLLPKGSEAGTKFHIFVMVSDNELDQVEQVSVKPQCSDCTKGNSFCGLKDQKYPDKRAMGFPFDRPYKVAHLEDFKNLGTNMVIGECEIKYKNTFVSVTIKKES